MKIMDDENYPRPQLRRKHWISLDGSWRFRFDNELKYRIPQDVPNWPLTINVPFAPESERSGLGDTDFHRACWYEREFELDDWHDLKVLLHFGAVDWQARVWINDIKVVEHQGGHTPFSADITFALMRGKTQRISVWAEDDPHDLEKPRGKQDWRREPHSIWYPRTTGIWQPVWLEYVSNPYIETVRWTPNLERWEISFDAYIGGTLPEGISLSVRISCGNRVIAEDNYQVGGTELHRRIGLSDPGIDDYRNEMLWSPERPTLMDAEIRLIRSDGTVIDEVFSYTALRSIGIQSERLLLNGRPYSLRLVLDQGYWPDTLMTPPNSEALRRDVELVKAMGFNGVRKHQKIEDPRYLLWADLLGLLVFTEMPSAYRFTRKTLNRLIREWTEVIERDISHPCVIVWVPFNESWGVPDLPSSVAPREAIEAFYHLTRALDQTRLVIGNDGWESSATDIIGIHDYDSDPNRLRTRYGPEVKLQEFFDRRRWAGGRILTLDGHPHQGQPVLLSEFGGVAFLKEDNKHYEQGWGYIKVNEVEEYANRVYSLIEVVRCTAMFSGFCYTQFADTFQEANGLLYDDRTPKIPLQQIAKAVCGEPHV